MKYIFIFFGVFVGSFLFGQQKIQLEIHHTLGAKAFQYNQTSQNNLDHYFTLRRLDYYLSGFKITHDGGKVTAVPNSLFLISLDDTKDKTVIDLGSQEFENIEKIDFMFGIDSTTNHSDPALYPIGHPLGPRFPTMHWGWAAGYRFIAVEGKTGPANNQEMQLHALGNQYHKPFSFDVSPSKEGDITTIKLVADYTQLFYDISIKQGVIVHGTDKEIVYLVKNVLERVFSSPGTNSVKQNDILPSVYVFPNPSQGSFNIDLRNLISEEAHVIIYNSQGQKVLQSRISDGSYPFTLTPGTYWISIQDDSGNTLKARPLFILP
ncbi:MAG: MbnP family protein [Saprospiraceae bacterium]